MPLNGTIKEAQHNPLCVWTTKRAKQSFFLVKRAGRHFSFLKRAGRHQKGAGRRALQKRPRQNTVHLLQSFSLHVLTTHQLHSSFSPLCLPHLPLLLLLYSWSSQSYLFPYFVSTFSYATIAITISSNANQIPSPRYMFCLYINGNTVILSTCRFFADNNKNKTLLRNIHWQTRQEITSPAH